MRAFGTPGCFKGEPVSTLINGFFRDLERDFAVFAGVIEHQYQFIVIVEKRFVKKRVYQQLPILSVVYVALLELVEEEAYLIPVQLWVSD